MDSQCVLGICYIGFAVSVVLNTCTVKDWVTTDDGIKEDSSHRSLCAVRAEDHINSPYIMSSGKSTESTIFYAERFGSCCFGTEYQRRTIRIIVGYSAM